VDERKKDRGWEGEGRVGEKGRGERGWREGRGSLGERKNGRGIEGINLPHGRLKTLAALYHSAILSRRKVRRTNLLDAL